MRNIDEIIVHCSATKPSQDIGATQIRAYHTLPKNKGGRGWTDIGYHFVIMRDGTIEDGRPLEIAGAHCYGHNANTIGICMVGGVSEYDREIPENNFNPEQFEALDGLLRALKADFGIEHISGHRDYAAKACPSFDIHGFVADKGI